MNYEIKNLPKINMSFLRLLTCNGGHKDVPDNIARAFKDNHDIHAVCAMDVNKYWIC